MPTKVPEDQFWSFLVRNVSDGGKILHAAFQRTVNHNSAMEICCNLDEEFDNDSQYTHMQTFT